MNNANGPVTRLLDTNVVSEMMRPDPDPHVAGFLAATPADENALSAITVWEVENGIRQMDPGRRREDRTRRFHDLLDELREDRVFPWTDEDARVCADIMEIKRRRGESLDDHLPDAMIASIALRRGLAVITRNTAEFRNIGVEVIDPWLAEAQ